jgi:hypothetical protein
MLQKVLAAQIYVPLAEAPLVEGNNISNWKPATITRPLDGSRFLVAFTDPVLMNAFAKSNPTYSFAFLTDTSWIVRALPVGHGIVFNLGGDNGFEWNAQGISEVQAR